MHFPLSQIENSEPICCTKHAHFQHLGDMSPVTRNFRDLKVLGLQTDKTILGKKDNQVNNVRRGKKRKRANVVVPTNNGFNLKDLCETKYINWKQKSPKKTAIVPPQAKTTVTTGWIQWMGVQCYTGGIWQKHSRSRFIQKSWYVTFISLTAHRFHLVLKESSC